MISFVRRHSNLSDRIITNESHIKALLTWNPDTPYSSLQLPNGAIAKDVKQRYHQLAKIYHPDLHTNTTQVTFTDTHGHRVCISRKELEERFRRISAAYQMLRDTKARRGYDISGRGWVTPHGPGRSRHSTQASTNRFGGAGVSDHEFFYAGTWEDFARMRAQQDPGVARREREELNRIFLTGALSMAAAVSILWLAWSVGGLDEIEAQTTEVHEKCLSDLERCYTNYGFEQNKVTRINRFLWLRKLNELIMGNINPMHIHPVALSTDRLMDYNTDFVAATSQSGASTSAEDSRR
ncbi:hypothetical protein LJB42_000874 [Komagataella kurtzmanii]|nr:hypothetical protein LJB42_000874 [Komagataella kurtzmanii]